MLSVNVVPCLASSEITLGIVREFSIARVWSSVVTTTMFGATAPAFATSPGTK